MNAHKILKTGLLLGFSVLLLNFVSPIKTSQATYPPSLVRNALQWNNQPGLPVTSDVEIPNCDPSIDIRKQEEGPDTRVFPSGADILYEIVVTNTGDVELSNVEVTDSEVADCNRYIGTLAINVSYPYTCQAPNVTTSFTNIARVEGWVNDRKVWDEDPSSVLVPTIDIRKQEEGPDTRVVPLGDNISYEIVVTNTGYVELSDVEVTDSLVADCNRYIGTLAIDQPYSYTCEAPSVITDFTNIARVEGWANDIKVWDEDPSSVETIRTDYNITVGYEDLKLVSASDFDYNDWVVSILTDLEGDDVDEDSILLEKITFNMTPMARGAVLGHEFHLRFMANTFGSNGVASLVIQDRSGTPLISEETDFIASETRDFLINFDITQEAHKCDCEAFGDHPENGLHNKRNTDEDNDIYNVPARRNAVLSITFTSPIVFDLPSYGQHCEGLFFDPHLHIKAAEPYDVTWMREDQKSEPRILCVKDPDWKWPEEKTRIDYAYNRVVWLDKPTFFEFPPDWDAVYNTCVFDNIPCGTSPLQLYLPVITR